ncbi:hypothetical protein BC828DRAFT_396447 [Blastocladiella britannica]|nr:hypothetical protein BC828DRAFT_396447 [Blastocladiella britannica]
MATDDENTPTPLTVLLLGWADGSPAHVAKYQVLYPAATKFFVHSSRIWQVGVTAERLAGQGRSKDIVDFLRPLGHLGRSIDDPLAPTPRKLLVHLFSNGGVQTLATLMATLDMEQLQLLGLSGLIIDSAPTPTAQRRVWEGALLFTMPLGLPEPLASVARVAMFANLLVMGTASRVMSFGRPVMNVNRDMLIKHPSLARIPVLFLYSGGDEFIHAEDVEWVMQKMAEYRVSVAASSYGAIPTEPVSVSRHTGGLYERLLVAPPAAPKAVADLFARSEHSDSNAAGTLALAPVSGVRFPADSPHVQHYRKYPNVYRSAVSGFVAKL